MAFLIIALPGSVLSHDTDFLNVKTGNCAVEHITRNYLKKMCTYDNTSALATIALADEMQFSRIWQQADEIIRAVRHLDRQASFYTNDTQFKEKIDIPGVNEKQTQPLNKMLKVQANTKNTIHNPYGGCVMDIKVLDERWIEIVEAKCAQEVNEALKIKLAHLYVPGPMNDVQGAKIRRRQVPLKGLEVPLRLTGGLSHMQEEARLKDRLCLPYVPSMYFEVCEQPLPDGYLRLCENGQINEDILADFWMQRQEMVVQKIIEDAQKMAARNIGQDTIHSRIYSLDIQGIEASPNGLIEIEVCPEKSELIDMLAQEVNGGTVRKTQSGLIWDMKIANP